ncbi:MAG: hypothetical protein H6622_17535 [Halobacteriovoraceae bacterium]|nr:hypothetical protein [Halobacteriovoraceae bacterium]
MKLLITFITIGNFLNFSLANTNIEKKSETVEKDFLDYSNIKEILKADQLDEVMKKKKAVQVEKQNAKEKFIKSKYNYPTESETLKILNEYWLVKSAAELGWNFKKPDYGLDTSFKEFLEKMGHLGTKFRIMIIKNSKVSHFSLPFDGEYYTFLISSQFMRSLDLSRAEISLILMEDFYRSQANYFYDFIMSKELKEVIGKNFYKADFNKKVYLEALKKYDEFVFKEGFSFKQQFYITKKMDSILKNDLTVWGSYLKLIEKIDDLVKTNVLFNEYTKIYPSPELQLNWLKPAQKNI